MDTESTINGKWTVFKLAKEVEQGRIEEGPQDFEGEGKPVVDIRIVSFTWGFNAYACKYKLKETSTAEIGKFFTFDTIDKCILFGNLHPYALVSAKPLILKCEIIGNDWIPLMHYNDVPSPCYKRDIKNFWSMDFDAETEGKEDTGNRGSIVGKWRCNLSMGGVVLCRQLKPVKIIDYWRAGLKSKELNESKEDINEGSQRSQNKGLQAG